MKGKGTTCIARNPFGLILALVSSMTLMWESVALAQVDPRWIPTGSLNIPRSGHTATLLFNGKVLVVGGWNGNRLNSAELYDPASGTWSATGSLNIARDGHTATLLANGKVLVAGGSGSYDGQRPGLNSAELYDPTTGTWSVTGSLNIARDGHTATLLPNGKVLIAGGLFHGPTITSYTNSAELYDPATASWTFTGSLHTERAIHTATRLQNGKILVVGGTNVTIGFIVQPDGISSTELYDPATETWSVTGSLNIARSFHTATLLSNGNVLAAGGWAPNSAELYDPATGRWNSTGALHTPSYGGHTATLLRNGQVLLTGVLSGFSPISDAQLYDPATGNWRATTSLSTAVLGHTATLLPNGKVLVAGGYDVRQGQIQRLNGAELYDSYLPRSVDFDGDGRSDIGVYRNGAWYLLRSSDGGVTSTGWGGLAQDIQVPADYDGDGKTDIAVYRDGIWFILRSSDGSQTGIGWGGAAPDIPLPADYDGDGKADIAVYRDGIWFIIRSSDGAVTAISWGGLPQDMPVSADYDGDGKADIALYRDGTWFILRSSDGGQAAVGWGGVLADVPVPADYDGDGKTDLAIYRDGGWYILRSSDGGITAIGWGLPEDIPVPADFDGDGKADVAVYRDGMWFIAGSSGVQTTVGWGGAAQDIPLK
jgi:Kelch motif/Galactose oxidase, central domain